MFNEIVGKNEINDRMNLSSGIPINGMGDQKLAYAKYIVFERNQIPVSELLAEYTSNGDVEVTLMKDYRKTLEKKRSK